MNSNDHEYNLREAAQKLGVAEVTLRRMIRERSISFLRVGSGGGRIRVRESDLKAYLQRRTCVAAA